MPRATTQTSSAKCTPSTINATRSSPDRSADIRSVRAASVALTNRREIADLLVEVSTDGDVIVVSPVRSKKRTDRLRKVLDDLDREHAGAFRRLAE